MSSQDPVAAKSGFLCMYMSSHPDTLVSYVKHYGKVTGKVSSAKLESIDTNGMNLSYTAGGNEQKSTRITFDPPLLGYEEVKPRLMNMKVDAEEALGMTRAPQITGYHVDQKDVLFIAPLIALLVYTTFAPAGTSSPLYTPAVALRNLAGPTVLKLSWGIFYGCHILEAVYSGYLCRKHRTGLVLGAQYVLTTFALGFPGFKQMRKVVQEQRINSIMKGK